ncbi:Sigma 54 interacting domain protein [Thermocrinis albus DSM 14484]|uniref:Sigma 54 interacting domain protein n=1 Tax=Thermocrinis albus (strain DSM 14484 / JCM 11386 / HI 11/12) TaxID=638303 RepID=D3SLW2_THEAH|nr:sigma-54 dependent transcriptional regulator [Thermocrinis albus]ADC89742.1 Sigma 54 interacting domain protein [Thermocrinis albus DSM 14484]
MKVLLCTRDKTLCLNGVHRVEEPPEDLEGYVILLDVDTVGLSPLADLRENNVLVAITANSIPGYVMKLISLGFYDVLRKPVREDKWKELYAKLEEEFRHRERVIPFRPEDTYLHGELCEELCSIAGSTEGVMGSVLRILGKAASVDVPVLITGESGTGKESFARALWKLSSRWRGPFVAVNCAAIPHELFEAELFGYEKGAFTGATSSKRGLMEEAEKGILFLDEVGELPLSLQSKLLRVLQDRKIRRLGSNREIPVNFRLVCATNRDLKDMVKQGLFREDLYYRISVIHIHIPPLRERRSEIPMLLNYILSKVCKELGKRIEGYTEDFLRTVLEHPWPGNVRELENAIRKAVTVCYGSILTSKHLDLPSVESPSHNILTIVEEEVRRRIRAGERNIYNRLMEMMARVMAKTAYEELRSQVKAAEVLGITRTTLRKLIS